MTNDVLDSATFDDDVPLNEYDEALAAQVQQLIRYADPYKYTDRRTRFRYAIPFAFQFVPLGSDDRMELSKATIIVGKDLSNSGISFSHDQPFPCSRGVISLMHPDIGRFAVEVDILWTRRSALGIYESGGQLLRTARGHSIWPTNSDRASTA